MKVLIANAWGGNRGDEAMINSLSKVIRSEIPGSEVYVAPFRAEEMDVVPEIRKIQNRAAVYYYSPLTPLFAKLKKLPKHRLITGPLLKYAKSAAEKDAAFPSQFDLIISAPQGPTISDMYGYKEATLHILSRAQKAGVRYAILGVSMGPFKDGMPDEKWAEGVLMGAEGIVVREDLSLQNVLAKYPSLSGKVESYIDMVFTTPIDLAGKDQRMAKAYADFLKTVEPGGIGACVSLTPARDPKNSFDKAAYIATMTEFFDYVIEKTGRTLYLFPHLVFDVKPLTQIREGLKQKAKAVILPREFDSEFQQDFLTKLDFFISTRYHPTIFAIKARTPFMCIKNQFKVEGMLAKLGIDHPSCWQDEDIAEYKRVFDACWASRETIAASVRKGGETAAAIAKQYNAFIRSLAGKGAKR